MEVTAKALREVEFREKMRGYHPEDVDHFLEQVAAQVEVLQDRLRQAVDRAQRAEAAASEAGGTDDTLRKTLVLAQRTADLAVQEAREQAARILASAEQQAQAIIVEAEERGRKTLEDAINDCKAELARLENNRAQAQQDVDGLMRWIEEHKAHLQASLSESMAAIERAGVLWPAPSTRPIDLTGSGRPGSASSSLAYASAQTAGVGASGAPGPGSGLGAAGGGVAGGGFGAPDAGAGRRSAAGLGTPGAPLPGAGAPGTPSASSVAPAPSAGGSPAPRHRPSIPARLHHSRLHHWRLKRRRHRRPRHRRLVLRPASHPPAASPAPPAPPSLGPLTAPPPAGLPSSGPGSPPPPAPPVSSQAPSSGLYDAAADSYGDPGNADSGPATMAWSPTDEERLEVGGRGGGGGGVRFADDESDNQQALDDFFDEPEANFGDDRRFRLRRRR